MWAWSKHGAQHLLARKVRSPVPAELLSTFSFLPHSTFYKEAVENAATYNGALMRDRRERLPYIDSQTGIAQRGEGSRDAHTTPGPTHTHSQIATCGGAGWNEGQECCHVRSTATLLADGGWRVRRPRQLYPKKALV